MDLQIPEGASNMLSSPTIVEQQKGQIYVNGRPADVSLLSKSALATFPLLPSLVPLINNAFRKSHIGVGYEYLPASVNRLRHTEHLLDTIGPDNFIIIVTQSQPRSGKAEHDHSQIDPDTSKVLGTVSAGPFKTTRGIHADDSNDLFTRAPPSEPLPPNLQQWELKLMVVDPSIQKQGLASKLLELVTEEVRRRAEGVAMERRRGRGGASMDGEKEEGEEVQLIFSTLKEVNYEFYLKRGFVCTLEKKVEPGVMGSRDGFWIVEMMKRI